MDSLDYDHKIHITPNAGDENLLVRFFIDAVEDQKASALAGRKIFKDVEWIDIRIPGNRNEIVIRPVRPIGPQNDIDRFPRHYAAFKARIGKDAEQVIGTPLSAWPWAGMTRSRVEELKFLNIRTVEQLAGIPDSMGGKLMGFQAMKQAAAAYLESTKASAPIARLQAQLEAALLKIEEQGNTIAKMAAEKAGVPVETVDAAAGMRADVAAIINTVPRPKPKPKPKPVPKVQPRGKKKKG